MRLIPLKKSEAENDSYTGYSGEVVSIPTVGIAVHDQKTPGGVLLTPPAELSGGGVDNIVRNSNFIFDQNGSTWLGNSAYKTYVSDGWFVQHGGGSTSNVARQSGWEDLLQQPTHVRVTTFTGGLTSSFSLLSQRYARLRRYAGHTMTLSYWARSSVATSVSGECGLTFADAGTDNRSTLITRVALQANVWQKVEQTFIVPAVTSADVVDDAQDHMFLYFWLDAGDDYNDRTGGLLPTSAQFDIGNVKVQFGEVATEYTTLPFRDEEKKVFEYFETSTLVRYFTALGVSAPNSSCGLNVQFNHPKWTSTVTVDFTSSYASTPAVQASNQYGFSMTATGSHATSSARVLTYSVDAEIQP